MSLKTCLQSLQTLLKDFDTEALEEVAREYHDRGFDQQAAEIRAIEDHIHDLQREKSRIEKSVVDAFKAEDPVRAAEILKSKAPAVEQTQAEEQTQADDFLANATLSLGPKASAEQTRTSTSEPVKQPSERDRLLAQAAELRDMAERGLRPVANKREAERLEAEAAQLPQEPSSDPLVGTWQHQQYADVAATVSKTDKGYRVEWAPNDVQEFKGAKAAEKTAATLEKEGYKQQYYFETVGGERVFSRFSSLGGEFVSAQQSFDDASELIGIHLDDVSVKAISEPNRLDRPAYFDPANRVIYVNEPAIKSRAAGAQYVAEEILHAVDAIASDKTISAGSLKLDARLGEITNEARTHYAADGSLGHWLDYPLGWKDLPRSHVQAELFARLGVLYFGHPELMQSQLPKAYEVFHEIFNFAISDPISGERVLRQVRGESSPGGREVVREPLVESAVRRPGKGDQGQRTNRGLEQLRERVFRALRARRNGTKIDGGNLKEEGPKVSSSIGPQLPKEKSPSSQTSKILSESDVSKSQQSNPQTSGAGMSVADVEAAINKAVRSVHESIGLKIEVVATNEDLPEDIRADIKPGQRPHGVLAPDGTVYLIAGNIPDAKAARIAFAHEVAGHVGVNRIVENWPSVIRKIQLLVKAGNKHAKEIDADVRVRYPNADADTYAKEFIALAAERKYQGPLARLISQIRAAIRKFFSKFGINLLTYGDIDIILADSEKYLRTGGEQGYRNAGLAFSQPAFGLEDDAMSTALKFISENTPAFKYPKSNATTMTEVAKDVGSGIFPGIEVSEVSGARMTDDLDRIFTISFGKKGKKGIRGDAIVRQYKNGTLETDVSLLKTGEYGSLIYQIIGDYAHNTGRVFVGDRHGLSYVAQIRRTEGMLSSALRWGTTAHLRPHNLQLDPEVQGVRPLKWKVGDDAHNLRELALTQSETMYRLVPELRNFGYNDKTGKFTRKGRSVDDKTFDRLVKTSRLTPLYFKEGMGGISSPTPSGRSTLKRAVWLRWLSREASGPSWRELLVRLSEQRDQSSGSGSAQSVIPSRIFYSNPKGWVSKQNPETQEALRKAGIWREEPTLQARAKSWYQDWGKKVRQGVFDQFDAIKKYDYKAYILARMTRSSDGALEALVNYGTVKLDADGALDVTFEKGGFFGILSKLNGEHERFMAWVIGNRAERLLAEGREHNFTRDDIARLKALSQGNMSDGKPRATAYLKASADLSRYNKAVMDIAEKAGLIDADARKVWEKDFYIPFYRLMEGEGAKGPVRSPGLVRQYAFKTLKGGAEAIGDPLHNILSNWSHLLDASLKNQSAVKTLEAAEKMGAAHKATADEKDAVFVMGKSVKKIPKGQKYNEGGVDKVSDGTAEIVTHGKVYYRIDDPFLLDAVNSLGFVGFQGPAMKAMQSFKRWLTIGVTASPTFRIRNLIRDSISMIGTNQASYNVLGNLMSGWASTAEGSAAYASIIAGGGVMRFGTILEGDRARHAKRLIESGIEDKIVLDTNAKVLDAMQVAWDWWQKTGDRAENINRVALYKKLRSEGKSHLEASYAARDSMDFSMQGTWAAVRFLTQTVPFMNARLQGLYRIIRGAKEDPMRFATVIGTTALASIALLLHYKDDDDWKRREDWDRETYWWFKVGNTAYRIPKPFEIGAIATLAERGMETMISDEFGGQELAARVWQIAMQQLSLNPVPQMVMPAIEVWANQDSFTNRPIETMGMERLSTSERIAPNTTGVAQAAGKVLPLSPVQIDHLISGYFAWIGTTIVAAADLAVKPLIGASEAPENRIDDVLVIGDFAKDLPSYQSKYVTSFYNNAKKAQEAMADLRQYQKIGALEKAQELRKDKNEWLSTYKLYSRAQHQLSEIGSQIKRVQLQAGDKAQKRQRLDALYEMRNRLAEITEKRANSIRKRAQK